MAERWTFDGLIESCRESAVHLEMRDVYTPDDPIFLQWKAGVPVAALVEQMRDWSDLVAATVQRGVRMRRARIVSEPITESIRSEFEVTQALNVAAGEQVRWLRRRDASDLALPGNDFWVFDNQVVRFGYFSGDGDYLGEDFTDDPAVVKLCSTAFEAVWDRAVDHRDYRPV